MQGGITPAPFLEWSESQELKVEEKANSFRCHLAIDGNRFKKYRNIKHSCIIKGDGKYMNIAAASILAKTHRDEYMYKIHQTYPKYDWNKNKGYPTKAHRLAISSHGKTEFHRNSFKLLPDQYEILFN